MRIAIDLNKNCGIYFIYQGERLIYIGFSARGLFERAGDSLRFKRGSPHFKNNEPVRIELEFYEDEAAARYAERKYIHELKPLVNSKYNSLPPNTKMYDPKTKSIIRGPRQLRKYRILTPADREELKRRDDVAARYKSAQ
jgi:hypothetical protein